MTHLKKYGSFWRLHYCNSKNELWNQKHDRKYSQRTPSDFDLQKKGDSMGWIHTIHKKITIKSPMCLKFSPSDDVLLYNDRVVIPNSLQRKIIRDFHMRHPGKNRTKRLIRCYVYWPSMDRDIADMIESSKGCAFAAKSQTTMCNPWPNTDNPWQKIRVDFAGL